MRNNDEFKSEIFIRYNQVKLKRKNHIKQGILLICILCIVPISYKFMNTSMEKGSEERDNVYEESNLYLIIKKESNKEKIRNKLKEYQWTSDIKNKEFMYQIQLSEDSFIEISSNTIMFEDKIALLNENQINEFKQFIYKIMEEENE